MKTKGRKIKVKEKQKGWKSKGNEKKNDGKVTEMITQGRKNNIDGNAKGMKSKGKYR